MKIITFGAALLLAGCSQHSHAKSGPQVDCTKALQYAEDVAATRQVTYGWVGYAGCWFRVKRNERLVLAYEGEKWVYGHVIFRDKVSLEASGASTSVFMLAGNNK